MMRILISTGDLELNVGPVDINKGLLSVSGNETESKNSTLVAASPKPRNFGMEVSTKCNRKENL
jgi:hypothetical protein